MAMGGTSKFFFFSSLMRPRIGERQKEEEIGGSIFDKCGRLLTLLDGGFFFAKYSIRSRRYQSKM